MSNTLPSCDISPISYITNDYPHFILEDTSANEIHTIIKSLKESAQGYDEIHIKVIKKAVMVLAPIISKLINLSFHSGVFPEKLNIAKIIPIHKGGRQDDISNYRPISILPAMSKVFETSMNDRLYIFLLKHNILTKTQFGFRKNFSSKLALTELISYILKQLGGGSYAITLFLDLKKAFHTLNHNIILSKMERYGIKGNTLNWFTSYLQNRQQYTVLDNKASEIIKFRTFTIFNIY